MPEMDMEMTAWFWWILGIALIIIETFASGFFFLWMGVAALVVGIVLYVAPDLSWQIQLLVFAALSIASIVLWRIWFKKHPPKSDQPYLNRRGEQYLNRTFFLEHPIVNNSGSIKVDDTSWKITGPDLPEGTKVKVTGVEGIVLKVEEASD